MGGLERGGERRQGLRERALRHAMRRMLLELLSDGEELSPREMRVRLRTEAPLSVVSYHTLILQEAGLVEAVGGLYRLAPGSRTERAAPRRA